MPVLVLLTLLVEVPDGVWVGELEEDKVEVAELLGVSVEVSELVREGVLELDKVLVVVGVEEAV